MEDVSQIYILALDGVLCLCLYQVKTRRHKKRNYFGQDHKTVCLFFCWYLSIRLGSFYRQALLRISQHRRPPKLHGFNNHTSIWMDFGPSQICITTACQQKHLSAAECTDCISLSLSLRNIYLERTENADRMERTVRSESRAKAQGTMHSCALLINEPSFGTDCGFLPAFLCCSQRC